jgi:hypothetical protein
MEIKITQEELEEIVSLEREIAPLKERADQLRSNVKAMLSSGIGVELGRFDAQLSFRYMRNPPWRRLFEQFNGAELAEKIFKSTPGHTICDVEITEHACLPLWNSEDDDENDE